MSLKTESRKVGEEEGGEGEVELTPPPPSLERRLVVEAIGSWVEIEDGGGGRVEVEAIGCWFDEDWNPNMAV